MSSRELIARYLRERGRVPGLVALSSVMAATAWAPGGITRMTAPGFALAALTAFLLVLAFRVWDDLEDRAYDAEHHPTRVTVVARSTAPLRRLAYAPLMFATSLIVATPGAAPRLCALGGSAVLLAVWYRSRSGTRRGLVNSHVVLLKYPALAFAAVPATPSLTALAALYVGLCAYEVVEDPTLRRSLAARRLAISEVAFVSTVVAAITLLGGRLP